MPTDQPESDRLQAPAVEELELLDASAATLNRSPARGILAGLRWVMRSVLLALLIACLGVGWWGRRPAGKEAEAKNYGVVLTLAEGANYGDALVYVGDPRSSPTHTDDAELEQAIRSALASSPSKKALVQVAGGVSIREVDRVQRLVQAAHAADKPIEVTLALYCPATDP